MINMIRIESMPYQNDKKEGIRCINYYFKLLYNIPKNNSELFQLLNCIGGAAFIISFANFTNSAVDTLINIDYRTSVNH